jgi:hypothetical protein
MLEKIKGVAKETKELEEKVVAELLEQDPVDSEEIIKANEKKESEDG